MKHFLTGLWKSMNFRSIMISSYVQSADSVYINLNRVKALDLGRVRNSGMCIISAQVGVAIMWTA